jgi:hypothetical protein
MKSLCSCPLRHALVFVCARQIEILFTMATNLSTTYRALSMISMVLRATVNKSLKDMDKKLTNLANLIYSLVMAH